MLWDVSDVFVVLVDSRLLFVFCYLSIVLIVVVIRMLFHNTVLRLALYGFKDSVLMHVNRLDIVLVIVGVVESVVRLVVSVVHNLSMRILLMMLYDRINMTLHDRLDMTFNDFRLSMKKNRLRQVLREISV